MPESSFPSKTFSGVRFALVGFNPVDGNSLRSKLLSGGGVEVGQQSQTCTHLIVDKIVYDDPICVAARSTGKVVVTGSWVDHSFDIGLLIDANSVLYRPLRDLNGIPGSKSLVVCLTGYLRQDREDIMKMVDLMGGNFSKPLVANRITHLICYKFEGEKYELAKRMKRIKVVNHRWLEDCLKQWKLLPEVDYEISGYELEMMEASARDSEDEAIDASVKRTNNSPLGLRVGAMPVVEISKSGVKDSSVVQTKSGAQEGSSFCITSKDNCLTPEKMDKPLEAMASSDAVAAQQHNYQKASTSEDTSNYACPIPVNKTPEQETGRIETDDSKSINRSIRRHSSLATYSRNTFLKTPETKTLGKESTVEDGSLKMDDMGLKASAASNSGSCVERTTLFEDFDKIDKLLGEGSPVMLPQAKILDGSVSSRGSQKVHHKCKASIPPPASLLLQELRLGLPNENLRPMLSINDPTENGKVGHEPPAKLLSSNVVPMEDAIPTAKNIVSSCARNEILEKSLTEPMVGNILLQETRPVLTNICDQTEGRKVAHKLDVSDSATRLFTSNGVPIEADIRTPENVTLKVALEEVPERSVTEPIMGRSSTSPGSDLIGMKDKQETDLLKKKTAPRKSLGTRGRKKNPSNQKGSIYLREPSPKDEHADCLNEGKVSSPVTDNGNQKDMPSPVLNTEALPEMGKDIDSETVALKGIDTADNESYASKEREHLVFDRNMNQDNLRAKTPKKDDAVVEITMLEPELNDVPTKDPSDGALELVVDKNKSKRKREATLGKGSLQSGKEESSSTAKVGKSSVKKTKKECGSKASDAVVKETGDNSAEEKGNVTVDKNSCKVGSGGDQSLVSGKPLARKNTVKSAKPGKESKQPSVEPLTKKECGSIASSAVVKETGDNSAEEKENVTVDNNSCKVGSGDQSLISGKPLARKNTVKSAKTGKESKQPSVKPLTKKECGSKASNAVVKETGDNSAEEMENVTVDKKSYAAKGRDHLVLDRNMNQDNLRAKTPEKADAVVDITMLEPELNDVPTKDPSDGALELVVDKNKSKRKREATLGKSSLQSGKKESSSTAKVGKSSAKKTKKECGSKASNAVAKSTGDNSAEEKENVTVDKNSCKVESGGDQSLVSRKPKNATKSAKTCKKEEKESKQTSVKPLTSRKVLKEQEPVPKFFIVSGPRSQRHEYQQIIKRLKGKCCRDSHQWSYQATHFIASELRRTEKFFAAAASGSWILKTDYVADSKEAGKLLAEEPYEWHSSGLSADGSINLESPRKWRLVREKTGHGAFYGMRIVVYGDCTIPSLDTLKRAVKAGDGTILATAPPYTRFLNHNTDLALVSPGTPHDDVWIQEFIRHEIPCVLSDYLVEYVCKHGHALDKHVLFNTNSWAERTFNKMQLSCETVLGIGQN